MTHLGHNLRWRGGRAGLKFSREDNMEEAGRSPVEGGGEEQQLITKKNGGGSE